MAIDPRSAEALGEALTCLRRYPEALEAIDRAMAIAPLNLQLIQDEVNICVARGDLAGARAVFKKLPPGVGSAALAAFIANEAQEGDITWVLDSAQRELLLGTTPSAFGDDRGQWGLTRAAAQKPEVPEARRGEVIFPASIYAADIRRISRPWGGFTTPGGPSTDAVESCSDTSRSGP
jgi:hypothetical protein